MRRSLRRALGIAIPLAGLMLAQRLLDPAPIPAAGVVVGGLLACLVGSRRAHLAAGALAGLLVGAAVHFGSHVSEGRAESLTATTVHVALDAVVGGALGAVLLGPPLVLGLSRRTGDRASEPSD